MTPHTMRLHIYALADAFHVRVIEHHEVHPGEARALRQGDSRVVLVAPITDETIYASALHELGHLVHPLGGVNYIEGSLAYRRTGRPDTLRDLRLLWASEEAAWEWAMHYAMEWTDVMDSVRVMCLNTYREGLRRYGVDV